MKLSKTKVFILLISILTGLILMNNINPSGNSGWTNLSAYDYKEAIEERNALYKEISELENQNSDLSNTVNSYLVDANHNNEKLVETMREQLNDYNMLTGVEQVKGPGVILEINDGDIDPFVDTEYTSWQKTFHDNDMAMIINEIRKSGAEAFAMNNRRILSNSGVSCNWAYIGFEDDGQEYAPFYISIIGDPEKLEASLLSSDSYIDKLKRRGLKVSIKREDEIILKPTSQNNEVKYMQILDKK